MSHFKTPFFVRVCGTGIENEIEKAFGQVTYINDKTIDGEVAFITKVMTGGEMSKAAESLDVISQIRVSR